MHNTKFQSAAVAGIIILSAELSFAGTIESTTAKSPAAGAESGVKEKSAFDELWGLATLYKNDDDPLIQEFKLRGRYHGQYHWLDSNQGDDDDWENRRSRFGFDAKLFNKQIELRLDAQSNDEFDPFYDRLVDAYIKWKPSAAFSLTLGKQKPQIGYYDWLQSTNAQPTFERAQIFNQLRVDRTTGAVAEGKMDRFTWQAGIYSNEVDREFGSFKGGVAYGAGIGYDLKSTFGLAKADWRFDWLHSDSEVADTVLNRYENLFSTTLWLKEDRWSLVTEAMLATGGAPDAFGLYLLPTYDLVPEKFQIVGRYSFSTGDGGQSLRLQSRYEAEAPALTATTGDTYHAVYLGFQYFIYGDKLKVLGGAEYSRLSGGAGKDFEGVTVLTGLRLSF